ncbi:hypothetical protein D918_01201, partial [Trichuris suis]
LLTSKIDYVSQLTVLPALNLSPRLATVAIVKFQEKHSSSTVRRSNKQKMHPFIIIISLALAYVFASYLTSEMLPKSLDKKNFKKTTANNRKQKENSHKANVRRIQADQKKCSSLMVLQLVVAVHNEHVHVLFVSTAMIEAGTEITLPLSCRFRKRYVSTTNRRMFTSTQLSMLYNVGSFGRLRGGSQCK